MDLDKKPEESEIDYHKRLVYGKLVDRTLSDSDYSEIAEKLYGKSYASDVARRMLYGSRKTLDVMNECAVKGIKDSDMAKEIDDKITELNKERQKYRDQRREYAKFLTVDSRSEHLYSVLEEAAKNVHDSVGDIFKYDTTYYYENNAEAVIVFSDWHYGMTTNNAFNTYNTDICIQRVTNVVDTAIAKILLNRCSVAHIVVLGDMIHGGIHESARVASEELVCDQLMNVSEILAQAILRISKSVDKVNVYTTYGNHGRVIPNKKDNIHRDNFERVIPWWLEQRLSGCENISVINNRDDEFILVNAAGYNIVAAHGDLDSVSSSLNILPNLFRKRFGVDIDCILLGDKHHSESKESIGVTSMICGSLCGSDDYANEHRLFSEPEQLMLIFDEDGLDTIYRLKC